MYHFHTELD